MRIVLLVVVGLATCLAAGAQASTLYVGSGGYLRIQDAIDAAAAGDTIRIGPGWHSYWSMYEGEKVYARVDKDDLHFIGAGMNATFVGPSAPQHNPQFECPRGFYAKLAWGVQRVTFEDLAVGNLCIGVFCDGPQILAQRCRIWEANDCLAGFLPSGGLIRDCVFQESLYYTSENGIYLGDPSDGVMISGCRFENTAHGISDLGGGTTQVIGCEFVNCVVVGLTPQWGTHAIVRDCRFNGGGTNLYVYQASADIADCTFEPATIHNANVAFSSVTGTGNIFGGGGSATLFFEGATNVELHNNHIFRTGPLWVDCYFYNSPPLRVHHLEHNYWGTDDVAEIRAAMSQCPYLQIEIEPLADGPVQTERSTWGNVKAMFR